MFFETSKPNIALFPVWDTKRCPFPPPFPIFVFPAPEAMDPLQNVKSKDSATLMVEFTPRSGATHYIIRVQNTDGFYREDTVSGSPAEIRSLAPYTDYTLSIMAANAGGRSQPSIPVTAKTGKAAVDCRFDGNLTREGWFFLE